MSKLLEAIATAHDWDQRMSNYRYERTLDALRAAVTAIEALQAGIDAAIGESNS